MSRPPVLRADGPATPWQPPALPDTPTEDTAPMTAQPMTTEAPSLGPALLDAPAGTPAGRIDHGWAPEQLRPRPARAGSLGWIAGGLAALLLGWLGISAAEFVEDRFARSDAAGWTALAVFGAAGLAVLWGLGIEWRAWRRLRHVGALRALLADHAAPVAPARVLALEWLDAVAERLPDPQGARQAVAAAPDLPALRAALHRHVDEPLRRATRRAADAASIEGAVAVAISPSPALDGVLAGLRGLALLRQVAAIHGLRPGGAVTWALLRRVAADAAGTSATGLLIQTATDGALQHVPVLRQLAAALPGAGLAALRLRRLADATAVACSPLGPE